jgi:hypothetical protein
VANLNYGTVDQGRLAGLRQLLETATNNYEKNSLLQAQLDQQKRERDVLSNVTNQIAETMKPQTSATTGSYESQRDEAERKNAALMQSGVTAALYGGKQGAVVGGMIDKFKLPVPVQPKPRIVEKNLVDETTGKDTMFRITTDENGKELKREKLGLVGTTTTPSDQWVQSTNPKTNKGEWYDKAKKEYTGVPTVATAGTNDATGFNNLPPQSKDTWFETYKVSGKMPPFAFRDATSRNAFTAGYAEYLQRQGITPTEAVTHKVTMDALGGSLKLQERSFGMMNSFINNLNQQVEKVKTMRDDVIKRVGVRALDLPIREWATRFKGSGNEQVLASYLMEISNEIGKISTGSQASIAELSVEAQDRWNKVHDPNLSMGELIKVLDATKEQANIRKTGAQQEITATQEEMQNVGKKAGGKTNTGGEKKVVRKGFNKTTNQTQLIYDDGTSEIVDGKR